MSGIKSINLVTGSIPKNLFKFSLPILVTMLLEVCLNLGDRFIIGHFADVDSLAIVGIADSVVMCIIALSAGAFVGSLVRAAQAFGANNKFLLKQVRTTSYYLLIIVSVLGMILGLLFSRPLLQFIDTPERLLDRTNTYVQLFFVGTIGIYAFWAIRSLAQGVGDSITPLYFFVFFVILKIFLSFVFIVGYGLGALGAGLSLVVSSVISTITIGGYYHIKKHVVRINFEWKYFSLKELKIILSIGIPAALHFLVITIVGIALQNMINKFPEEVIAGLAIARGIDFAIVSIPLALSQAVSAFVGQNIGADNIKRAREGFNFLVISLFAYSLWVLLILKLSSGFIMTMFTSDTLVIYHGELYLTTVVFYYFPLFIIILIEGFFEGVGLSIISFLGALLSFVCVVILTKLGLDWWGELGIYRGLAMSWVFTCIMLGIVYKSGFWVKRVRRVEKPESIGGDAVKI